MKILYDYQIFQLQQYGGISRYFVELAKNYNDDINIEISLSAKISNNEYLLNNRIKHNRVIPLKYIFKKKYAIENMVNSLFTRYKLTTNSIDLFHPTYYNPYFLDYIGDTPFVLTIYDMIHEKFSNMFSPNDLTSVNKKLLANRASKIIAISESTKKDIISILGIKSSKIDVVYLGNSMLPSIEPIKLKNIPNKYILFVGNRGTYKNFYRFIYAIFPLLQKDASLYLICAGGKTFSEDEKKIFFNLGIDNKVYQLNTDDQTLAQLYKQALIFVFPSLYEGFGIPILEAFACKCPIVCSNTSSLPEVAGDAAVYFDPMDNNSILTAISNVLNSNELRKELVLKGTERLSFFSWEKTSKETKKVYESIL